MTPSSAVNGKQVVHGGLRRTGWIDGNSTVQGNRLGAVAPPQVQTGGRKQEKWVGGARP